MNCPKLPAYEQARYQAFVNEITYELGAERLEHYEGRGFYRGPAVRCDAEELNDVIRATTVRVQWDTMGKSGYIVYPK